MGRLAIVQNTINREYPSFDELSLLSKSIVEDLGESWTSAVEKDFFWLSHRLKISEYPLFWSEREKKKAADHIIASHSRPEVAPLATYLIDACGAEIVVYPSGVAYSRSGTIATLCVLFENEAGCSIAIKEIFTNWFRDRIGYFESNKILGNTKKNYKNRESATKKMVAMAEQWAAELNKKPKA